MNYQEFLVEAGKHLRSSPLQIEKIIKTAPFRYKHYTIPKRSGGERSIYHPSPALKAVQRWMVRRLLGNLPVHESVYSYVDGKNIGMNATAHVGSNYFVRFDFRDFFPSITGGVLRRFLGNSVAHGMADIDEATINAVVRLACRVGDGAESLVLSIGAPSSPHLSNALLYEFDSRVQREARAVGVVYTRYADDVYISSRNLGELSDFECVFRSLVRMHLPFLSINEDKIQHLSRKRRVTVTGINITSDRKISVGRDMKRRVRTELHLAINGLLDVAEHSRLRGTIAYIMSVEPDYLDRLGQKFGRDLVDGFMKDQMALLKEGSKQG